MKCLDIGRIFSICVPDKAICRKGDDGDDIQVLLELSNEPIRFFLFSQLKGNGLYWSYRELRNHVENVISSPFQTSVEQVNGKSWIGYQAVTALDDSQFLVNRIVASMVSDYAVRIEFKMTRNKESDIQVETVESLSFGC